MRRYDSYKDSGVEWLGDVPSHWELKRLKQLFVEKKHKQNLSLNCGAISFGKVIEKDDDKVTEATKRSYQEVLKGEFLINPLNLNYDLISLRIALSEIDVVVSAGYIVLKAKQIINKKYFSYLLHRYDVAYMKLLGSGVRQTINYGHISDSILVAPPLSEQQKIAQFLDDKTAKIDQAVDLAEKQIALLKEHKQILIQNAVTRGLNPDVPLKDSGVEWLGDLPSHWDVQRSKFIFKKIERKVNEEDQIVTCFRDGQVTLRANRRTEGFTNALKEHGYQGIRKGDLVIHAMDAFAGAIGISDSDGKATPVYSVCLPRDKQKIDVYFYAYYLRNLALSGFISSLAKGIRERSTDFRYADFAELLLPIPPYLEQQKIAQFLDDKTAKIDQAVDLTEKQIALLKEHKQILIQNAVTQGLNPDVSLKDSGVEWIGQVPEHWEVSSLGKMLLPVSEKNKPNLPLLSITRELGVIERDVEDQESNHNFIPDDLSNYKVLKEGQFGMNKMKAWQGSYGVSRFTGIVSPAYYIFDFIKSVNSRFFHWAIRSKIYISFFGSASDGVRIGQWDLSKSRMKSIPFIIPSYTEQVQIADYLDQQAVKIDQAIALKTAHIEKLKEYKSVLINDVVTGKVRVSV